MSKEEIGKRIKAARLAKGFTQAEVANYLKVTPQAVSNFERGKNRISNDILKELCELYQISADILLDNAASTIEESANNAGDNWLHDALSSLHPQKFRTLSHRPTPLWIKLNREFTDELYKHLETMSYEEKSDFLLKKIDEINPSEVEFFIASKLYEGNSSDHELLHNIVTSLPSKYLLRIQNIKSVLIALGNVQKS